MIYATADANPCIPIDNLPTAHKHYRTYTNLCSTIKSALEACCNLSTAANLQQSAYFAEGLHQSGKGIRAKHTSYLRNP